MYDWIVFIHVLGAFAFVLAHGTSMFIAFRLRAVKDRTRIAELLELSGIPGYAEKAANYQPPATPDDLDGLATSHRPEILAAVGGIGLLAIIWLMVVKPF